MRPTVEMDSEFDTDYATEGPLPTRVPYDRSPMLSRHPSRGQSPANPTNGHGRMSPPLHRRTSQSHHHDGAFDEKISILDPRRFTPTLHANLVAEILSLRRELESKNQLVETLEAELDETRADAENATANVASALKEARDVKRQLARAEKDDAMAVVAQERDEAVMALEELKKQMERLAKSRRAAEEDLEQLRKIQESDNEKFEEAKRVFERRAHVAEGRLKAVLDELASRNTPTPTPTSPPPAPSHRSHQRVMSEDYGGSQQSDAASIRSISFSDRPGSLMMGDDEAERLGISLHGNGMSLADELNFDDSEEEGTTTQDEAYPQTDDMLSDGESVDDVDELPELADMGVQVEPEIDYEERLQELEDLLGERVSELERVTKSLGQKTVEVDALHTELEKSQNVVFDLQEKLDFLNAQGAKTDQEYEAKKQELDEKIAAFNVVEQEKEQQKEQEFALRSKELDLRSSELDTRSSELDEKLSELNERSTALDTKSAELDTQSAELASRSSELDTRSSQLDARSFELEKRTAEVDVRALELEPRFSELDSRKSELDARAAWLDARSLDLDEVVDELEATKKMNDERSLALDDREIELEERERVLSAEEAEIKELKEWVDSELTLLKEGQEEPLNVLELETILPRTSDAFTEPLPSVYVSTESQTTERQPIYISTQSQTAEIPSPQPPARPMYASKESQTDKPPFRRPPARPLYATTEVQTDKIIARRPFGRPMYTTTLVQTEKPLSSRRSPVYASTESQTTERPSPKPAYISIEIQTAEIPSPKLPVCISAEAQTNDIPAPVCVSTEVQTTEIPRPVCVSIESQTTEIPPPPPPVYVTTDVQTTETPKPKPPVYTSTESQTAEAPSPKLSTYISTESQTVEIPLLKPQGYVSTESQTAGLPSPPATPLRETPPAMLESTGIQTDHVKPAKPTVIRVPAIMVSPPEPTPPLPQPAMKDATVQTRPIRQRTRSMQTEQISLDERLRKFAPHLLPSALLPKAPAPIPKPEEPTAPALPRRSSKRTVKRSVTAPVPTPEEPSAPTRSSSTNEAPMSITTSDMGVDTSTLYTSPKTDDDLEVSRADSRKEMVPKNIFNNIDLSLENDLHSSGEEFPDDVDSGNEYQTALSARPRKSLRNAPQLKLNLETDLRRQPSIRRGAMVASGINAHARTRSPSLTSNHTEVAGSKIGPPFPVPARNSSKRPGYLSDRERATPSPTPTVPKLTRNNSKPKRPQSIRKVRSATIMPSTRDGAISPGLMSTSSNAPSSPGLPPPLPNDNISSPAFDRRRFGESKHKYQASTNTSNTSNTGTAGDTGQASVGAAQQTSVVDAIAQTMVGEWMWKYVRRRKTFGVSESPQGDDVSGGQRHKRWVWLAPYERAVMWSSKQPTSGSALLGKSGRKRKRSILHPFGGLEFSEMMDRVLTNKVLIQSVLDVKDDTPPPKGATQPVFNRSILILTPARALKFTAPTKERHYVWLTALSFLSHSPESGDGLLALPPPMPFEYEQLDRRQNRHPEPPPIPPAPPARTTKNAFSTTRDSVRLAKGKTRASPAANGHLTVNTSSHLNPRVSMESTETLSAEPPSIPRFPGSRRRSNSHVHRPQTRSGYEKSLDSYKTTIASSNRDSFGFDSFRPDSFYGVGGIGLPSPNSSNFPNGHFGGGGGTGLWDPGPIGTVRMEAFIDRRSSTYSREYDEFDDASSKVSSYRIRRDRRMSRYEGYWSGGGGGGGFYDEEDFWRGDDPFRNF